MTLTDQEQRGPAPIATGTFIQFRAGMRTIEAQVTKVSWWPQSRSYDYTAGWFVEHDGPTPGRWLPFRRVLRVLTSDGWIDPHAPAEAKVIDPLSGQPRPIEKSIYAIDHDDAGHRVQRPGAVNPYCRDCEITVYESAGGEI